MKRWQRSWAKRRRRREFLDFMNGVIDCYGNGKEIHVILDNLKTHNPKNDRWLKSHPNVHFHFTQPTLRGLTRLNAGLAF